MNLLTGDSVAAERHSSWQPDKTSRVPAREFIPWDRIRQWKVVNLDTEGGEGLPVIQQAEPFAPCQARCTPPEFIVIITWLQNGDVVNQRGHSKKIRKHMVMPVKVTTADGVVMEGWVTRSLTGASRKWFEYVPAECVPEDPVPENT